MDRDELARTTGLRLPADCRDFVTLYGGGELDEYLGVSMPPVAGSPYGGLVDGLDFDPREEPVALVGTNPEDVEKGGFFPARSSNVDVVFRLCDARDPDSWDIVAWRSFVRLAEALAPLACDSEPVLLSSKSAGARARGGLTGPADPTWTSQSLYPL